MEQILQGSEALDKGTTLRETEEALQESVMTVVDFKINQAVGLVGSLILGLLFFLAVTHRSTPSPAAWPLPRV